MKLPRFEPRQHIEAIAMMDLDLGRRLASTLGTARSHSACTRTITGRAPARSWGARRRSHA